MELRDYLNVLRARKWTIIQAVIIVTLAAVVLSLLQPPVYEGEAKVLISEKDAAAALFGLVLPELSSQPERALQTQVQLMQMRPLLESTIRQLDLKMTPEALSETVVVRAVGQTNVVSIVARAGDPDRARDIANTLAEGFVDWSRDYKRASIKAAISEVESRLSEAEQRIIEIAEAREEEGPSDALDAQLGIASGAYGTLVEQLEQLKINEQLETGSGTVVSPAVRAAVAVEPSPARNAILGLAVGLVFGLAMAFLYEYLDNTIKGREEAEAIFGAPVLGTIPAEKLDKGEIRRLSILTHVGSPAAEAYRVLRNNLDFVNFDRRVKRILVSSAAPTEGKSTVAANLAAGLAQAGHRVVLVNCDFRKPTTAQYFSVSQMIGLSDVLMGTTTLKSALQRPREDLDLLVLTSGKLPPNPSEILGSPKMGELVESLEDWADWVILDSPPLLAVADGAAVSRWVDGVLLVTRGGVSTREGARRSVDMLKRVGARVIGVVAWGLEPGTAGIGYGYFAGKGRSNSYYYYSDYYSAGAAESGAPEVKRTKSSGRDAKASPAGTYVPPKTAGRRLAEGVGRVLTVTLGIIAFLAVVAIVLYALDEALGWGLLEILTGLW